jgi:hypothetical protein
VVRITLLLALASLPSLAATTNCMPGTLQSYIELGSDGCQLGTRIISEIALSTILSGGSPIDPTAVTVTPAVMGITASLLFTFDIPPQSTTLLESVFEATVNPASTGDQLGIRLLNAMATGDAAITGTVDLCDGSLVLGTCFGRPLPPAIALVSSDINEPFGSTATGPVLSYGLNHDIVIDPGTNGTASLGAAQLTFTAVPEPGTFLALMTGLTAMFVVRRRLLNP